jgi:diphthamide biosynthesis methyltransferase
MSEVYLTREEIEHPYANLTVMLEDKRKKAELMRRTLFDRITASPEVLAPNFVVEVIAEYLTAKFVTGYRSIIIPGKMWEHEAEAIAATVAKLKEVEE